MFFFFYELNNIHYLKTNWPFITKKKKTLLFIVCQKVGYYCNNGGLFVIDI